VGDKLADMLKQLGVTLYPPEGEAMQWWDRLKVAMGTASSEFVDSFAALISGEIAQRGVFGDCGECCIEHDRGR
jgi:hypothetical protein